RLWIERHLTPVVQRTVLIKPALSLRGAEVRGCVINGSVGRDGEIIPQAITCPRGRKSTRRIDSLTARENAGRLGKQIVLNAPCPWAVRQIDAKERTQRLR